MKEVQTVPGIQFHNSVTKLACSLTFGAYAQEFPAVFLRASTIGSGLGLSQALISGVNAPNKSLLVSNSEQ